MAAAPRAAGDGTAARRTFAQIIAASKPPPAIKIGIKPPSFTDAGEPATYFSREDCELSWPPFRLAAIVRCSYGRCSIPEIKSCLTQRLGLTQDFILDEWVLCSIHESSTEGTVRRRAKRRRVVEPKNDKPRPTPSSRGKRRDANPAAQLITINPNQHHSDHLDQVAPAAAVPSPKPVDHEVPNIFQTLDSNSYITPHEDSNLSAYDHLPQLVPPYQYYSHPNGHYYHDPFSDRSYDQKLNCGSLGLTTDNTADHLPWSTTDHQAHVYWNIPETLNHSCTKDGIGLFMDSSSADQHGRYLYEGENFLSCGSLEPAGNINQLISSCAAGNLSLHYGAGAVDSFGNLYATDSDHSANTYYSQTYANVGDNIFDRFGNPNGGAHAVLDSGSPMLSDDQKMVTSFADAPAVFQNDEMICKMISTLQNSRPTLSAVMKKEGGAVIPAGSCAGVKWKTS